MLEVIEKTVRENENQQDLFLLLLNSLQMVCYKNVSPIIVFVKFMLISMKTLGFALNLNSCACCEGHLTDNTFAFSYDYNGLLCPKCANKNDALILTRGEFVILKNVNETAFDKLSNLKFLSRDDQVSVIKLLCKLFFIHTDEQIESLKQFL